MNAVLSLCHFCEIHGPRVLISTQPSRPHCANTLKDRKFYGPQESLQPSGFANSSCEACQSLGNNTYVSSDHEAQTSYVTSQYPWQAETEGLIRQACTRSLSCEVSPGKEGVLVYSDDFGSGGSSGCSVLSHTFLIRDSLARGFHRWFSIIVLTRDCLMLLNMWPFLEKNISAFVSELQNAANKVYDAEQSARPQRALRLNNAHCADRSSRSLQELTGLPQVFAQLHLWFVWLLRNAVVRLRETLPVVESTMPYEPLEEEIDGYTFITAKRTGSLPERTENSLDYIVQTSGPSISSLSMLRSILGPGNFLNIVFCLVIGRQVVVRGQPAAFIASILFSLQAVLPKACVRLIPFSSHYISAPECNMLGLEARAAVPQPSPQVARLEVLPPADCETAESLSSLTDASQFSYHLKWPGQLPAKLPTFIVKLDRAMQSGLLSDTTLMLQIKALRMEALNAARVLHQLDAQDKKDNCDLRDKAALLQALGVNSADAELLSFWSKSCFVA